MARPDSPPLESTSSSIRRTQSATPSGGCPGPAGCRSACSWRRNLHHRTGRRGTPCPTMERVTAPSPRAALGVLTGLNLLNYLDRYIPAGGAAADHGRTSPLGRAGRVAAVAVHPRPTRWSRRWSAGSGDRRARFALGGRRRDGLERGHLRRPDWRPRSPSLLLARALIGVGEASYAVVTPSLLSDFYPAGPARPGAGHLLRGHPGRASALGYVARRRGRRALRVARRLLHRRRARALVLALALLLAARSAARGALDTGRRRRRRSPSRRRAAIARLARARRSYLFNTAAQTIYTFAIGGLAFWMPTYFVRERGTAARDAPACTVRRPALSGRASPAR